MWSAVLTVAGILLAYRYARIWWNMARVPIWMRRCSGVDGATQRSVCPDTREDSPHIVFVIPALEEYFALRATLDALRAAIPPELADRISIQVVTTEKEAARRQAMLAKAHLVRPGLNPTGALERLFPEAEPHLLAELCRLAESADSPGELERAVKTCLQDWPYTWTLRTEMAPCEAITWIHSEVRQGCMADQLNFALSGLLAGSPRRGRTYVVVYNADTVAAPRSIVELHSQLVRERCPEAAQLMCISMLNFSQLVSSARDLYLAGAAIYQSRWALGYEFSMLRHSGSRALFRVQSRFHYCRGHGMTFRLDYLAATGGFERSTALEDLFQGYLLSCQKKPCSPVPVIEWTESPTTLRSLIRQKRYWYSGMLDLPQFPRFLRERGLQTNVSATEHAIIMLIGWYREVFTWLAAPTLTVAFMVLSMTNDMLALGCLPIANALISTWLVLRVTPPEIYRRHESRSRRLSCYLTTAAGVLLYSLSRNWGPALAIADRFRMRRGNRNVSGNSPVPRNQF